MPRVRLDLPLARTAPGRLLAWLTGGLVYLAVVMLAVVIVADRALLSVAERAQLATVILPVADDADVGAALDILHREPAVLAAARVSDAELDALMTPWLGDNEAGDLPLPAMIDVRLDPRAGLDVAALRDALSEAAPGATLAVDPDAPDRAGQVAALLRGWSGLLLVVALPAALLAIGAITRLGLRLCREAVELLRDMGASPDDQAAQLERHALACGLRGGGAGFGLALLTVAALLYSSRALATGDAIELGLRPLDWGLLGGMAATSLLLAVAVVRATAWRLLQEGR